MKTVITVIPMILLANLAFVSVSNADTTRADNNIDYTEVRPDTKPKNVLAWPKANYQAPSADETKRLLLAPDKPKPKPVSKSNVGGKFLLSNQKKSNKNVVVKKKSKTTKINYKENPSISVRLRPSEFVNIKITPKSKRSGKDSDD